MATAATFISSRPIRVQPSRSTSREKVPNQQHYTYLAQPQDPLPVSTPGTPPFPADGAGIGACDVCYQKRSLSAMKRNTSIRCARHSNSQECTFYTNNQAGKRKYGNPSPDAADCVKRQAKDSLPSPVSEIITDYQQRPLVTAIDSRETPSANFRNTMAAEIEPLFVDFLPQDWTNDSQVTSARIWLCSREGCSNREDASVVSLETVENLVTPFGPALLDKYFKHVHPTLPIIVEDSFRTAYKERKDIPALLLGAVYLIALKWLEPKSGVQTLRPPDAIGLETLVCRSLNESLSRPQLATVQAGLLLSQKPSFFTPRLVAQLVTAGFDLGLHQDCSSWQIQSWEKGLRKRLAWALYMQDKWCALVHSRPSHIFASDWAVKDLIIDDFENTTHSAACTASLVSLPIHSSPSNHEFGCLFFCQLVKLTRILSDIIESFYTLEATQQLSASRENRIYTILSKAKPLQIQLKDWFGQLPADLKVDADCGVEAGSSGGIHLAYFATEIMLHRCIVRSISPETADQYLIHICRSAAKTRLISAMEFVNRLRPIHLRAFWPAAAKSNFALIGAFGVLLQTTAPTQEEEEFYRARLREYRWTLSASRKDAEFLDFAIDSLDGVAKLIRNEPQKPAFQKPIDHLSLYRSPNAGFIDRRYGRPGVHLRGQSVAPSHTSQQGDGYYGSDEYENLSGCAGMHPRFSLPTAKSGLVSPAASASSASIIRRRSQGNGSLMSRSAT
ncbi:transcriptional activator protein DAL81 [Nannizzia gypsea CBS 118893]|uniref:Transcriptional activator protein DAL81 n=1 Tax=Arthroderma gypseum (strain ATCC MYA-4604 / CBS 118893) TaxID=535722 RepID=E4V2P0_ARTGP|nr:transcriptional activator protein DAL81 [Nannizzia gypsea CBS 118893]EFR03602.1 transcriptional activator protein DAL81 [Nannizzia gypsea CBS 118893]